LEYLNDNDIKIKTKAVSLYQKLKKITNLIINKELQNYMANDNTNNNMKLLIQYGEKIMKYNNRYDNNNNKYNMRILKNIMNMNKFNFNNQIEPKENSKEFSIWPNPKVFDFRVEINNNEKLNRSCE